MTVAGKNILEISELRLSYRTRLRSVRALHDVSLAVGEGEAVGLVGESGSGKSTVARASMGLLPEGKAAIEGGRIVVAGQDVTAFDQQRWVAMRGHPVAMVFQDPLTYLNPVMRIGRQIAESVQAHAPGENARTRVAELIDLVRLPAASARAFPHELSGGMRQRALLAVALGCRPRLLIADEPTTALDVTTQAEILALLKDLRQRLGMALLLISHDLGIVASACARIYVMYAGHVVEWGATGQVFDSPAHPYARGLLKAASAERDAQGHFVTIGGDPPNLAELGAGCPFAPRCGEAVALCRERMPAASPMAGSTDGHMVRCWSYAAARSAAADAGKR